MANKQIHELPAADALDPSDQLLVSKSGTNLTRRAGLDALPFQLPLPGSSRRTIAAKLGEVVSVKDYPYCVIDDAAEGIDAAALEDR